MPNRPARRSRAAGVLLLALALFPAWAGVAAAHGGGGLEPAPSFPRIIAVDPPIAGLTVEVIEAGDRLRIENGTAATVQVLPPVGADRRLEPVVPPGGTARWPDPRIDAAAHGEQPAEGTRAWAVPMTVGDQPVMIRGEQVWPQPPTAGLWWLATALAAIGVAALGALAVTRRPAAVAAAAVTIAVVAAHVVHVLGSALVSEGQPYLAVVLGAAGIGLVAWLFGLVGAALTLAGRPFGLLLCSLAGAVLALLTAFDTNSFSLAVLPFAWDPSLDRISAVLTFGGGLGLFLTGFAVLQRFNSTMEPIALAKHERSC